MPDPDEQQMDEAADAAAQPEEGDEEQAPRKSRSGTWLLLLVGALIIVLTPLATYVVVKKTVQRPFLPTKPEGGDVLGETTKTHALEQPIFVNIAGTKGTRILKIDLVLIVSEGELVEKIGDLEPVVRDKVLSLASTRTIEELETSEVREMLKKEIMDSVNDLVRGKMSGSVIGVCFNEFLIQ